MKYFAILSLCLPLITACGGGSGNADSATKAPPAAPPLGPFTVSIDPIPTVLDEHSQLALNVTAGNVKTAANVSFISSHPAISISKASENVFTLATSEVDRDTDVMIQMQAIDGADQSRQVVKNFSVKVLNSSFKEDLALIEQLHSNLERIVSSSEELQVLKTLTELVILRTEQSQNSSLELPSYNFELRDALQQLNPMAYKNGSVADADLLAKKNAAMPLLNQHLASLRSLLNEEFSVSSEMFSHPAKAAEFYLTPELNSASFFIGNPDFGSIESGKWLFKSEFSYLSGLLEPSCTP